MGEVYRARDTTLKRDVALKALPIYCSSDPDRLRRFELEAQAVAALSHPNIVSIFSVGQHNGFSYIVTELLQGETLRDWLRRGPLRVREVVDLGAEMARGLGAAHAAGIVHRDLKPENMFLTRDEHIKILDFGLAKLVSSQALSVDSPTVTFHERTSPGLVLGTIGYMSLEQVRGEMADVRSDIFAVGVILYEMLTGKSPFRKETSAETMAAILNEDPPALLQTAQSSPPGLQKIVNRCLSKNPEQRFQHPADLAFALEALSDSGSTATAALQRAGIYGKGWGPIAFGAVVLAIAGAFVYWWTRSAAAPVVESITQLTDDRRPKGVHNSLQTDGPRIYFNEGTRGSLQIAQMAVTGGPVAIISTPPLNAQPVGIAPDGSWLLVLPGGSGPPPKPPWGIPLPTGEPNQIGTLEVQDGGITPDGRVLMARLGELYLTEKDGSNQHKIIGGIDGFIGDPNMSPDGQRIVFTRYPVVGDPELYVANSDGSGVGLIAKSSEPGGFCCAQWTPDGRYIVFETRIKARQDLWYLPMKCGWLQRGSEPKRLTAGPLSYYDPLPSRDGKQIFAFGNKQRGELVRYDLNSKQFIPFLSGISATNLTFSRDGEWVAYLSYPDRNLWRSRINGTERLQLVTAGASSPEISPDGKHVAYVRNGNIYLIGIDGGEPQAIVDDGKSESADWSSDGNTLMFWTSRDHERQVANFLNLRTGRRSAVGASVGMLGAHWIGNDQLIAADHNSTFMVFDGQTQKWSPLGLDGKSNLITRWGVSPDDKYLYYTTGGAEPKLVRFRLSDHKAETIASLEHFPFATFIQLHGTDTQVSIAPDGSPVFTHDIGTQEIYALSVKWP